VTEIDEVEIGLTFGGARARLLALSQRLGGTEARAAFFLDANGERVSGKEEPPHVWWTDHRDLEGYLLVVEVMEKIAAASGVDLDAETILHTVFRVGREVAAIRFYSGENGLDLPFQRTSLARSLMPQGDTIAFSQDRYLRTLLQNAGVKLTSLKEMVGEVQVTAARLQEHSDLDVVHGKDALAALAVLLRTRGSRLRVDDNLLCLCFERGWVDRYPSLRRAVRFLEVGD
jgi:hypothetical protein